MTNQRGIILVLSGISGCGKTHLTTLLVQKRGFAPIPSLTTRKARTNEPSIDRRFCSNEEFEDLRAQGRLVCERYFFGNWYALDWHAIETSRATGRAIAQLSFKSIPILRERLPDAKFIYIVPRPIDRAMAAVKARGLPPKETRERVDEITRELESATAERNTPNCRFDEWLENGFSAVDDAAFLALVDRLAT